jgi:hypothetical protein
MSVTRDHDSGDGEKTAVVRRACASLLRVGRLFAMGEERAANDLEMLSEIGILPNFAEFHEVAGRHGAAFTPELVAAATSLGLEYWDDFGAERLSGAAHVEFSQLVGQVRRIRLLRVWLDACALLADYKLGDETDRVAAAEAFRLLGLELVEWDAEAAVACGKAACAFAVEGRAVVATADSLVRIAGQRDDEAARFALTLRVVGMYRLWSASEDVASDLFDAFEAACRYAPTGAARDLSRLVLRQAAAEVDFLRPLGFLWKCVFDPESLPPGSQISSACAEPEWHFGDAELDQVIHGLQARIIVDVENQRLKLAPKDKSAVALTDLTTWSIDHGAFRQAIPLARSLLREAYWADVLLTLSHEVIHIQSAQGWLGIHLSALRIAATESELRLLSMPGAFHSDGEDDPALRLAVLAGLPIDALVLVEHQLELVRKAQLLRAIWLPWLEGIAVFGELSGDPTLDGEAATQFSHVISSMIDLLPDEVASRDDLSISEALRLSRQEAERLYADALEDAGQARLRTYILRDQKRYLAGYLAVRAVLTNLRRFRPFNGLTAYNALFDITTIGTRSAVPSLALPPAEFEAAARDGMLDWLRRLSLLDEPSVARLAEASGWKWVHDASRDCVQDADADDPLRTGALADVVMPLVMSTRPTRLSGDGDGNEPLPGPPRAAGHGKDATAARTPTSYDALIVTAADRLNDYMSLVSVGHVTAPFWLSLGGSAPTLVVAIRVTEKEREHLQPSYAIITIPLSQGQLAQLRGQMSLLRGSRMQVTRYADLAQHAPGDDASRGLGQNVLGLAYGEFTLVQPMGLLFRRAASPSLTNSVQNRLRPHGIVELDTTVIKGTAIAERAIEWIESQDFPDDPELEAELGIWKERVLQLARVVLHDDEAELVAAVSNRIVTGLGWQDGDFARVSETGLRSVCDEESPDLDPLLAAVLNSAAGASITDVSDIPDAIRSLLFEWTGHSYDFRRFQGQAGT